MITISKPVTRNSTMYSGQAYQVSIGPVQLYFSYRTLIAVSGPQVRLRLDNSWGPTTGNHINMFNIKDFPIATEGELQLEATALLAEWGAKRLLE